MQQTVRLLFAVFMLSLVTILYTDFSVGLAPVLNLAIPLHFSVVKNEYKTLKAALCTGNYCFSILPL